MGRRDYAAEREMFAHYLSLTKDEQLTVFGFNTQKEFAKHYKIPFEKLLSEWKRDPKFKKLHQEKVFESFKDVLPQARVTITRRAIEDGDVNALKEIFKIAGISIERIEHITDNDVEFVLNTISEILKDVLEDYPTLLSIIVEKLEEKLGDK